MFEELPAVTRARRDLITPKFALLRPSVLPSLLLSVFTKLSELVLQTNATFSVVVQVLEVRVRVQG